MTPVSLHPVQLEKYARARKGPERQDRAGNTIHKVVYLCPGPGFGTDRHPTTRSCLKCLGELLDHFSPERVLDAGTGNAILAIAAVYWGVRIVIAVDIQPKVLETARYNLILNGAKEQVCLCCGDVFLMGGLYDLIVANLNPGSFNVVDGFLENRLATGGFCILSGLSGFERDRVFHRLVKNGHFKVYDEVWDSGWTTFVFHRV